MRRQLGCRLARSLLAAFADEQRSSSAGVQQPPPAAPRPGGRAGGASRFVSLEGFLDSVPDWLVARVAELVPQAPTWLVVLALKEGDWARGEDQASVGCVATPRATSAPTQSPIVATPSCQPMVVHGKPAPRPPLEKPPEGKPSLRRRVLTGVGAGARSITCGRRSSTDEKTFFDATGVVPTTADAGRQGCQAVGPAMPPSGPPPRAASPRRFSWLSPRGRSQPPSCEESPAASAPQARSASAAPSVTAPAPAPAVGPSCRCYLYGGDGAEVGGGVDSEDVAQARAAWLTAAVRRSAGAASLIDRGWGLVHLPDEPAGVCGSDGRCNAVLFSVGRRAALVLPLSSLEQIGPHASRTPEELARVFRRTADADLQVLAAYLAFLATVIWA